MIFYWEQFKSVLIHKWYVFRAAPFIGLHLGDPCIYCNVGHDHVEVGSCPGPRVRSEINDILLRTRASNELGCTCDACLDIIRKESGIKNKIAGYLEFVATVQVIDEEFNRMATKSRLSGDASKFASAVIARKNAIGSARENLLIGPETPEEIDAVLRKAGYDPDEIGAQMKAAAEAALARIAPKRGEG